MALHWGNGMNRNHFKAGEFGKAYTEISQLKARHSPQKGATLTEEKHPLM